MNGLIPLGAALFVGACATTATPAKMSLTKAESFCAPKAQNYARRPIPVRVGGVVQLGLQSEMPDDFMVQDFYRRCVFANAGQRPSARLAWRL